MLLEMLRDVGLSHVEVLLEHELPYSPTKVDALLCGCHPESGEPSYVLIELKQWSRAEAVGDGLLYVAEEREDLTEHLQVLLDTNSKLALHTCKRPTIS